MMFGENNDQTYRLLQWIVMVVGHEGGAAWDGSVEYRLTWREEETNCTAYIVQYTYIHILEYNNPTVVYVTCIRY